MPMDTDDLGETTYSGMATRVPLAYPAQPEQIGTTGRLIQPDERLIVANMAVWLKHLSNDWRADPAFRDECSLAARVLRALLAREYPG